MGKFIIPKSGAYNKELKSRVPGGVHYSFRMPWESKQIHFSEGKGTRLQDLDGNEYLDFFCKFGANILGHNHTVYNEHIVAALGQASAVNLGTTELEVASLIAAHVPSAEMVRFSLSGTEAVQNALRLARGYTGREKFIRFAGHYHGNSDNIMGGRVGDLSYPSPVEFEGDLYDTAGKPKTILRDQSFLLPWNNLAVLDETLLRYHEEIAAIIMEPICINGGGILPAEGYLQGVRARCDQYGIVLIFDEIITGFRVGAGGAQQLLGVVPDLTTLGKSMAGGAFPVSAIVGKEKIMKLYENRKVAHGGTFNGYPLGMAAVRATLQILTRNNCEAYTQMNHTMREIQQVFLTTAQHYGFNFSMAGMPACALYNLPAPAEDISPKERMVIQYTSKIVGESLAEHGILLSNANRFYGNISVNSTDVDLFRDRIGEVFETVSAFTAKMVK